MSVDSVKKFFINRNFHKELIELEESSATVELAANALGVAPNLIAKTLAFKTKDKNILIVVSGYSKIDNKRYKEYFKTKAKMLNSEEVLEITGHPVGGVCPFGIKTEMDIYLDESLKQFQYVYPAAGSPQTAVKVSIEELETLTGGIWIDVSQS